MDIKPRAKPNPGHLVGIYRQYAPADGELHPNSDIIVVSDARDYNGNVAGDFVIAQRSTSILPNDWVSFDSDNAIAQYANPGFDPATLNRYMMYVRILDGFSHAGAGRLKAGWVSVVVAVNSPPFIQMPNVGDKVIHYPNHTIMERDGYAFVTAGRPLGTGHDYTYPAMAW